MLIYVVRTNDTLWGIARRTGSTVEYLSYVNQLADPNRIVPGMTILIPSAETGGRTEAEVNAYVYPNVSSDALEAAMPYLSRLSPFSVSFDMEGNIQPPDLTRLVSAAYRGGVEPLLVLTNIAGTGGFSGALGHAVLTDKEAQDRLTEQVKEFLRVGSFRGLNVDFEYLYAADRDSYTRFLSRLAAELHPLGYTLAVALAPKERADQPGLLYAAHDYGAIGGIVDRVILMTYEWGYTYGAPQAVSPVNRIRRVLDYAVSVMPSGKILMGFSNYGYNWTLPWKQGDRAAAISNTAAVSLAVSTGSTVRFDGDAKAPYFNYTDAAGKAHVVWFEDARSIEARLELVREYSLAGISLWTADRLYRPIYELIQAKFDVV